MKNLIILLLAVGVVGWFVHKGGDPYSTKLPLDTSHLETLQPQLDKLPETERELVLGYLKRSRGDVLPAAFADPDEPFTARTFKEAIVLQKDFLAKMAKQEEGARARRQVRDEALAPLREALKVELLNREILPRGEVTAPAISSTSPGVKSAIRSSDDWPVLVVTYRITNTSSRDIESLKASVMIRKNRKGPAELGILSDCYFTRDKVLTPYESAEIRCGNPARMASPEDRDFVAMDESGFNLDWTPKFIRFGDGEVLQYRD